MPSANREYPHIPRATTPDVPYQVNRVTDAIDADVQEIDNRLSALPDKAYVDGQITEGIQWDNITGKPILTTQAYVDSEIFEARRWVNIREKPELTSKSYVDAQIDTRAPYSHTHSATSISSGVLNHARVSGSDRAWSASSASSSSWATVSVDSNGYFFKYTSSGRYKKDVAAAEGLEKILTLEPKRYIRTENGREEIGLIAEEVEAAGLTDLVFYDVKEEGAEPVVEGIHYQLMPVALLAVARKQEEKINSLEERLAVLEKQITTNEDRNA